MSSIQSTIHYTSIHLDHTLYSIQYISVYICIANGPFGLFKPVIRWTDLDLKYCRLTTKNLRTIHIVRQFIYYFWDHIGLYLKTNGAYSTTHLINMKVEGSSAPTANPVKPSPQLSLHCTASRIVEPHAPFSDQKYGKYAWQGWSPSIFSSRKELYSNSVWSVDLHSFHVDCTEN